MTAIVQQHNGSLATLDAETMQLLVAGGDTSRLNPAQKLAYYNARCDAAGLDPRAQPFAFMRLNGKETLYALKAASDQLAARHGVKLTITSQSTDDGIRVVTVRAEAKDGRVTEEIGALPIAGLKGDALANAMMKAVTKAKRRAVLSLCGLGMLDETEVESVPQAQPVPPPVQAVRSEPRVVPAPETLEPTHEERQAAHALVEAAAAVETPHTYDARMVWSRLSKRYGVPGMRSKFIEQHVGRMPAKFSDLTQQELEAISVALDAEEVIP